jgi:hypothetical protein
LIAADTKSPKGSANPKPMNLRKFHLLSSGFLVADSILPEHRNGTIGIFKGFRIDQAHKKYCAKQICSTTENGRSEQFGSDQNHATSGRSSRYVDFWNILVWGVGAAMWNVKRNSRLKSDNGFDAARQMPQNRIVVGLLRSSARIIFLVQDSPYLRIEKSREKVKARLGF